MHHRYFFIQLLLLLCIVRIAAAQTYLNKTVTISLSQQPVEQVLQAITKQTGIAFSYHTEAVQKDSLVSISVNNQSVKHTLQLLFGRRYQYKEKGRYIIIQPAEDSRFWYVSGYVKDKTTGERLSNVSVYEPRQLVATLTNTEGYFEMRFKGSYPSMNINVSRLAYNDASFLIEPGQNQELMLQILPKDYTLDTFVVKHRTRIEDTRFGKMFLSSKQKLQSMNIGKFFIEKPFQISFVPGLGTHGVMSSQVVNKASLNILGGYNAGVRGAEVGGIFNLLKNDMDGVQVGGVYNMVGGYVNGAQISGVANIVFDSICGLQASGVYSHGKGKMKGLQIAGVASYLDSNMRGCQLSGVANYVNRKSKGVQIAGVVNLSKEEMDGVQISGVFNYAKRLKGVQIGLINICDSSEGYSVGLINISKNGYHKLSLFHTDAAHVNLSLKTGTQNIYSIVFAGMNAGTKQQSWTFGGGLGAAYRLSNKLSFNPELTTQHLYLGDWEHYNLLNRISLNLHYQVNKLIGIFAGPVGNVYVSNQRDFYKNYPSPIPEKGVINMGDYTNGWLGWNIGISFF